MRTVIRTPRPGLSAKHVAYEYEAAMASFPDASDDLIARMLGITAYDLRQTLHRVAKRAAVKAAGVSP